MWRMRSAPSALCVLCAVSCSMDTGVLNVVFVESECSISIPQVQASSGAVTRTVSKDRRAFSVTQEAATQILRYGSLLINETKLVSYLVRFLSTPFVGRRRRGHEIVRVIVTLWGNNKCVCVHHLEISKLPIFAALVVEFPCRYSSWECSLNIQKC